MILVLKRIAKRRRRSTYVLFTSSTLCVRILIATTGKVAIVLRASGYWRWWEIVGVVRGSRGESASCWLRLELRRSSSRGWWKLRATLRIEACVLRVGINGRWRRRSVRLLLRIVRVFVGILRSISTLLILTCKTSVMMPRQTCQCHSRLRAFLSRFSCLCRSYSLAAATPPTAAAASLPALLDRLLRFFRFLLRRRPPLSVLL